MTRPNPNQKTSYYDWNKKVISHLPVKLITFTTHQEIEDNPHSQKVKDIIEAPPQKPIPPTPLVVGILKARHKFLANMMLCGSLRGKPKLVIPSEEEWLGFNLLKVDSEISSATSQKK